MVCGAQEAGLASLGGAFLSAALVILIVAVWTRRGRRQPVADDYYNSVPEDTLGPQGALHPRQRAAIVTLMMLGGFAIILSLNTVLDIFHNEQQQTCWAEMQFAVQVHQAQAQYTLGDDNGFDVDDARQHFADLEQYALDTCDDR